MCINSKNTLLGHTDVIPSAMDFFVQNKMGTGKFF